jgi:hypothetical protein
MKVSCPECKHSFLLDDVVDEKKVQEIKNKMSAEADKKEQERVAYFRNLLEQEKQNLLTENATRLLAEKANLEKEQAAKMKFLEEENLRTANLLKESRAAELKVMQLKQVLKETAENNALEMQKALLAQQTDMREQLKQELLGKKEEEFNLKLKDKDHKLEELTKTINELKKRSEQGSMQSQGEGLEKLIEETLEASFPLDEIIEVAKGVRGADCLQRIKNNQGQLCGTIIFESKRTQNWDKDWIDKLKNDQRNAGAEVAVLVTQTFPKDMDRFGLKDGVWVCGFRDVVGVVSILRQGILRTSVALRSQENKGDKAIALYDYVTGLEFKQHIEAILEGYSALLGGVQKERIAMEKLWKEREKQLTRVLENTSGMFGSVQGIAGASVTNIPFLELGGPEENESF